MPIRDFIRRNFWLKLFSLVLACLIWFVVHFDLQNTGSIGNEIFHDTAQVNLTNVTVSILASADDPRRFAVTPPVVDVIVSGRVDELRRANYGTVRVWVDLRGMKQPEANEPVMIDSGAPGGVLGLRANPPVVTVREVRY